jgi:sugar-phosphatase
MAGVNAVISMVRDELKLPIAVASSSPMVLIDAVLHALQLTDTFGVVCSAQDVPLGKPHPQVSVCSRT